MHPITVVGWFFLTLPTAAGHGRKPVKICGFGEQMGGKSCPSEAGTVPCGVVALVVECCNYIGGINKDSPSAGVEGVCELWSHDSDRIKADIDS